MSEQEPDIKKHAYLQASYMHAGRRQADSEAIQIVIEVVAVFILSDDKFQSSILHTVLQSIHRPAHLIYAGSLDETA